MESDERPFTIEELAELTGTSRRTIRFYVQSGLLDRPEGAARGAFYTRRHLQRILDIQAWQGEGLTLEGIRLRLAAPTATMPRPRSPLEVWTRVTLADGVELNINPEAAGLTPDATRRLAMMIAEALQTIKEESGE